MRGALTGLFSLLITVTFLVVGFVSSPLAATTTYSDRILFSAPLGSSITDDYENDGYKINPIGTDFYRLSDSEMSSVLGETQYTTTNFFNSNLVFSFDTNFQYCSGCNGSFTLGFTGTSVGTADGVFGVGFNFQNSVLDNPFTAFVTFGDGSSDNFLLPLSQDLGSFFGIISDAFIQSIAFGLPDGGTTGSGHFRIDDLTIGGAPQVSAVPLPAALPLYGAGLAVMGFVGWRRKRKAETSAA